MSALPDTQVRDFPGVQRNFDATRKRLDVVETQLPSLVSSLPGSPVDKQEVYYLADATNGVAWHLRYYAAMAGSYKWLFLGGPPILKEAASEVSTASATYVSIDGTTPTLAVPLAGDFEVAIGARVGLASAGQGYMSYDIGGTGAVDGDSTASYVTAGVVVSPSRSMRKNGLTAVTLTCKYRAAGGTPSFALRWIKLTPIRVG